MNKIITIATILIILLFFIGCDKNIRNKYIGEWEFVTEERRLGAYDNVLIG